MVNKIIPCRSPQHQDFLIKYSLRSAKEVAEVASIGGIVKEYKVDIWLSGKMSP